MKRVFAALRAKVLISTAYIDDSCLQESIFDDCKQNRYYSSSYGAQWLSGRVLDSRPRGRRFESHRRHCVVSLSKTHKS